MALEQNPRSPFDHISQLALDVRTADFLKRHKIRVSFLNPPTDSCLIVTNHPTTWDPWFWRNLPDTFMIAHNHALKQIGIPALNRLYALGVSRMIPANIGDKTMRKHTYQDTADLLAKGFKVIICPTGRIDHPNIVPSPQEIKPGGTLRILEASPVKTVIPAYICIDGVIKPDRTVSEGTHVDIRFSPQPLDLSGIDLTTREMNDTLLAERMVAAWQNLALTQTVYPSVQ